MLPGFIIRLSMSGQNIQPPATFLIIKVEIKKAAKSKKICHHIL